MNTYGLILFITRVKVLRKLSYFSIFVLKDYWNDKLSEAYRNTKLLMNEEKDTKEKLGIEKKKLLEATKKIDTCSYHNQRDMENMENIKTWL